jgi:hypothetical protein
MTHLLKERIPYPINYRGRRWYRVIRKGDKYELWQYWESTPPLFLNEIRRDSMAVRLAELVVKGDR